VKKASIQALKIALAAGLVVALLKSGLVDLSQLGSIGDRWPWLLAAQLPLGLLLVVAALRWHVLMRARGVEIHFRETYAIMLTGWFFNQTMPSNTGGDVAKAWAVAVDHPSCRSDAIMSILVDRLTGLGSLLLFALCGGLLNLELLREQPQLRSLIWIVGTVLAALLAVCTLFYSSWLRSRLPIESIEGFVVRTLRLDGEHLLARFYRRARELVLGAESAVYAYRSHPDAIAMCVLLSVCLHTCTVAVNLCLTYALLGNTFEPWILFSVVPLAHIGMSLGITPGNLGVGEVIYAEVFQLGGIAQGGLICVLQRAHWIVWALIGGLVFMLRRGRAHPPLTEQTVPPTP